MEQEIKSYLNPHDRFASRMKGSLSERSNSKDGNKDDVDDDKLLVSGNGKLNTTDNVS